MEDGFKWLRKGWYIFGSVISVDVCTKLIKNLTEKYPDYYPAAAFSDFILTDLTLPSPPKHSALQ
jgi:hypothetical protein